MNSESRSLFSLRVGFITLFIAAFLNLLVLDLWVIQNKKVPPKQTTASKTATKEVPSDQEQVEKSLCSASCIAKINEATSSLRLATTTPSLSKTSSQTTSTTTTQQSSSPQLGGAKEFFVSFGSGSNSTDEWTDVPGLAANIDSTKYGQIKNVVFEATIRIPTGNQTAYVRLYNVTDNHPVWFSEVSHEGGTTKLITSNPITLDSGNKLYQVQMKTQLKFPAYLDQARVHIITL